MIERFSGATGRDNRIETLLGLSNISNDRGLAERIADECDLVELNKGDIIIQQGGQGEDVFFVFSGRIKITVKSKTKKILRAAPVHVGEMSALEPMHPRSATIVADSDKVIAGVVKGETFRALMTEFPEFERKVSADVSNRTRGWMEPNTEKSMLGLPTFFQAGGIALLIAVFLAVLFLMFLTTSLAIAASAAIAIAIICFFLSWISRAAILWTLFMTSAGTTISSFAPGLSLKFKLKSEWLQLDGGFGGEPSLISGIVLIIVTLAILYAALKVSASH